MCEGVGHCGGGKPFVCGRGTIAAPDGGGSHAWEGGGVQRMCRTLLPAAWAHTAGPLAPRPYGAVPALCHVSQGTCHGPGLVASVTVQCDGWSARRSINRIGALMWSNPRLCRRREVTVRTSGGDCRRSNAAVIATPTSPQTAPASAPARARPLPWLVHGATAVAGVHHRGWFLSSACHHHFP